MTKLTIQGCNEDMRCIKLLIMDVDGTLTDGQLHISNDGEMYKSFNIKDGYAIHNLLPKYNVIPVIFTGRTSRIVEHRCKELGIIDVYQGVEDKLLKLQELAKHLSISPDHMAYIGDDDNDLDAMHAASLIGCPSDASKKVKAVSNFISIKSGGEGAVREFIEWMIDNEYVYR